TPSLPKRPRPHLPRPTRAPRLRPRRLKQRRAPRNRVAKTEAISGRKPTRKAAREGFSATFRELRRAHPDAHCELDHKDPFELVVATVLSAQSTDVAVNKVTPELFRRFPTPEALALAEPSTVEELLGQLGMFRQKTKSLIGLSKKLVAD